MKKILITLALVATTAASFAQGKITIGNDANHLIVNSSGTPIAQAGGWDNLTFQLWGGTSAGSLSLQTTLVGAAIGNPLFSDGRINNTLFTLPALSGTVTLQLRFLDTATGGNALFGQTQPFTMVTGAFLNNSIVSPNAPSLSTWANGSVTVAVVPEPASVVLAGLGAASLLLFRRRN